MAKQTKQYGTWPSPLSSKALAGALSLREVGWDTTSPALVWLENRGAQGVLVMKNGTNAQCDLTSGDISVRGRVGYGGGEFTVANGFVFFAGPDGRIYRLSLAGGAEKPITPAFGNAAAPSISHDGKWMVFVHTYENTDVLALVDTNGEMWPRKLIEGTDFVMQPAWHPSGDYLAYIAWNHPQMPWDGTELRMATLKREVPYVKDIQTITGDENTSIFQPEFSPDGRYLSYTSNATGFSQLYLYDLEHQHHKAITETPAEHDSPAWVQNVRTYGWTPDSHAIYFLRNHKGMVGLWRYELATGDEERVELLNDYTALSQIAISSNNHEVALLASSSTTPARVISYHHHPTDVVRIQRRSASESIPASQLAQAEAIEWRGHDHETVHGLYYPPTNENYEGNGPAPLIVMVHGGPTSQRTAHYEGQVQFFATRGFGVLHVNYRGSTGYGKAYMAKLRGNWGIYDVEDSVTGAQHLAEQGVADINKVVIMGGSAGGFTVLQSLVTKPGFFKAGVCLFGVSNQFLLAQDTHKFEARYLDSLLGPLPEAADIYRERSPIFHAEKISDPIIVFQGSIDQVVPQNQSDLIVEKLKANRVPHEYHIYEGEGHGFRKPENIEDYHEKTLAFLMEHVIYA